MKTAETILAASIALVLGACEHDRATNGPPPGVPAPSFVASAGASLASKKVVVLAGQAPKIPTPQRPGGYADVEIIMPLDSNQRGELVRALEANLLRSGWQPVSSLSASPAVPPPGVGAILYLERAELRWEKSQRCYKFNGSFFEGILLLTSRLVSATSGDLIATGEISVTEPEGNCPPEGELCWVGGGGFDDCPYSATITRLQDRAAAAFVANLAARIAVARTENAASGESAASARSFVLQSCSNQWKSWAFLCCSPMLLDECKTLGQCVQIDLAEQKRAHLQDDKAPTCGSSR